ncbi:hypothetical protein MATL_G00262510 [Megalops atlanticus]|uniref:Tumor necrosis factor receptor superfamily member 19L n=1 Tax=Megalops atlanticus TaxID=7932 RepID=A0A9D3P906_MEGAT|nr:hypothetical protein MATL_G00262510 [Megalops atlanticus]
MGLLPVVLFTASCLLLGLAGALLCRTLKSAGYGCTEEPIRVDPESRTDYSPEMSEIFEDNSAETMGQAVHHIMKNKALTA